MLATGPVMAAGLQVLDDAALGTTTGQDGITILLTSGIIADSIVVHDKDGVGDANHGVVKSGAGAIVLGKQGVAGTATGTVIPASTGNYTLTDEDFYIVGSTPIVLKVDSDSNEGKPVLNINAALPPNLTINTGNIYIASSGGVGAAANAQYTNAKKILNSIEVALGGATLNVQLGAAPQGAMVKLAGTVTNGLTINNLDILDANATPATAGHDLGIGIGSINIKTANDTNWKLTANINARDASSTTTALGTINIPSGLIITNLGDVDVRASNIRLGNLSATGTAATKSIGDVALLGLKLPNVIITGH